MSYYQTNVLGTRHLMEAAKDAGVQRIVVMGGLGTKPDKPGSYMQGRYEADQAVQKSGLAYSMLGAVGACSGRARRSSRGWRT